LCIAIARISIFEEEKLLFSGSNYLIERLHKGLSIWPPDEKAKWKILAGVSDGLASLDPSTSGVMAALIEYTVALNQLDPSVAEFFERAGPVAAKDAKPILGDLASFLNFKTDEFSRILAKSVLKKWQGSKEAGVPNAK
jgi:hypothetical protein